MSHTDDSALSRTRKWLILSVNAPVDDIGFLRDSLACAESISCELVSADTPEEGKKYLREHSVDLVLLDFSPQRDDLSSLIEFVKSAGEAPILVLADTFLDSAAQEFRAAGVDDYFVKAELSANTLLCSVQFAIERSLRIKSMASELERLSGVERSLYSIVDRNIDALIVVDKDGVILYVNQAAEILFGRRKEGFEGEMFEFTIDTQKPSEIELVRPGGERAIIQMRAKEIEWDNKGVFLVSFYDITELVRIREEMRSLSLVDEATGLYNYRGFLTLTQQQAKLSQRRLKGMLLIGIDLLNFEEINEVFGPYEREHALEELAQILKVTFRRSDIIGRISKNKFAVLAIDATEANAEVIINRLNTNIDKFNTSQKLRYEFMIATKTIYYDPSSAADIEALLEKIK